MTNEVTICSCRARARRKAALQTAGSMSVEAFTWFSRAWYQLVRKVVIGGIVAACILGVLEGAPQIEANWCWTYLEGLAFMIMVPLLALSLVVGWASAMENS